MPTDFKRTDRIAEVMQRELAYIIQHQMKDPRFKGFVTISAVEVTRDLAHAKVYFTVYNADPATTLSLLTGSAGFLRTALSKMMTLRLVPQLHFIYDESIEYGQRLNQLIDSVLPSEESNDVADQD